VRRLFRSTDVTRSTLRWGEHAGKWRRIDCEVWGEGTAEPTALDRARALALRTSGVASGEFAGAVLGLDAVRVRNDVTVPPERRSSAMGVRRRVLHKVIVVNGIRCTDGLQTMVDLAATLDDLRWEQALESALHKHLVTVTQIEQALPALGRARTPGVVRMRRVLALRPTDAPPTESLLETLMVQLIRRDPRIPTPQRQVVVRDRYDQFVARVDLALPECGVFFELDGEHHRGQPLYDASRQTAVTAATGWPCGRFTWSEVVYYPTATLRRVGALVTSCAARASGSMGRA
jgi:very-short-patch-repair endonuclease